MDEFRDDGGAGVLVEFLTRLARLDHIQLLVSSRPEQYFNNKLEHFPRISMEGMTKDDIAQMVMDKMAKCVKGIRHRKSTAHLKFNISDETVAQIEKTLIAMSDGVFLWVHFVLLSVLDGLENDDDPADLLARLQRTPTKLEDLYRDMLARASPVYHQYAGRVFHIILELPLSEQKLGTTFGEFPTNFHSQTILTYAAILETDKLHSILKLSHFTKIADQIELLCQNAAKAIITKTSGLVEAKIEATTDESLYYTAKRRHKVMMRVQLIHQTARSFLEGSNSQQILQVGTISEAYILKGLFYSWLALAVLNYVDEKPYDSYDSRLFQEIWNILSLLSQLVPYDEYVPLAHLLYHIGHQCDIYRTIQDFFYPACDHGFYKLIQDLLEGQIQYMEREEDERICAKSEIAYEKDSLLAKVPDTS